MIVTLTTLLLCNEGYYWKIHIKMVIYIFYRDMSELIMITPKKGIMLFSYQKKLFWLFFFLEKSSIFKVTSRMKENTYNHPIQFTKIHIIMSDFEWIPKILYIFYLPICIIHTTYIYPVHKHCIYFPVTKYCGVSLYLDIKRTRKKDQIKKTNWYTIRKSVHNMSLDHSPYHLHSLEWVTSSLMHGYKKACTRKVSNIPFFFFKKCIYLFLVKG